MDHVDAVITRIGLDPQDDTAPTLDRLTAIQTAFVTSVPYETLDIQLGRPPSINPTESLGRIAAGKGGYCFNLNTALRAVLDRCGFATSLHIGGVHSGHDEPNAEGNHAVLTVEIDDVRYLADAGLGDGPIEPMPLTTGVYPQGPLTFELRRSNVTDGWQLLHDPKGSFTGCDFKDATAGLDAFADQHTHLSTSPESGFVRTLTVLRRLSTHVDILRSRTLSRVDESGTHTVGLLGSEDDLIDALAGVFGYAVDLLDDDDRARLWQRVVEQHAAFSARGDRTTSVSAPT